MKLLKLTCLGVIAGVTITAATADADTLKAIGVTSLFLAGSSAALFCVMAGQTKPEDR